MQSEGKNPPEAQSPPPPPITVNTASIDRSLLCLAVGQIVINIIWRAPRRPPLQRLQWSHWLVVAVLVPSAIWSAWWLVQFAVAHTTTNQWSTPLVLFTTQLVLSLALLEWGVLRPVRMARTRQRAA